VILLVGTETITLDGTDVGTFVYSTIAIPEETIKT
jgi:hypothetical protein